MAAYHKEQKVLILKDELGFESKRKHKINTIGTIKYVDPKHHLCHVEFDDGIILDYHFWEIINPAQQHIEKSYVI